MRKSIVAINNSLLSRSLLSSRCMHARVREWCKSAKSECMTGSAKNGQLLANVNPAVCLPTWWCTVSAPNWADLYSCWQNRLGRDKTPVSIPGGAAFWHSPFNLYCDAGANGLWLLWWMKEGLAPSRCDCPRQFPHPGDLWIFLLFNFSQEGLRGRSGRTAVCLKIKLF